MLEYKKGVKINENGPLKKLLEILKEVSVRCGLIVVTSGNDGKHCEGSAHYRDRAIDIRSKGRNVTELKELLTVIWASCSDKTMIRIRVELNSDPEEHYWWKPGVPFRRVPAEMLWDQRHIHIEVLD